MASGEFLDAGDVMPSLQITIFTLTVWKNAYGGGTKEVRNNRSVF